jgi:hypothetical protein
VGQPRRQQLCVRQIGAREHRALQIRAGEQGLAQVDARQLNAPEILVAQIRDLTPGITTQERLVFRDNAR